MKINSDEIKSILVFKLCCFGDVVFMTPVIRALKKNFPESAITYLASSWVKDLIKFIPETVNELFFDLFQQESFLNKIIKGIRLVFLLRKNKFDLVFLGHRNNFLGIILRLSGIKYRMGFKDTKFINVPADYDGNIPENLRYLKILRDNGYTVESNHILLNRHPDKTVIKQRMNLGESEFITGIFPFGGINPGTEMDIKRWEGEKYTQLIHKLSESNKNSKIIIFEGTGESEKFSLDSKFENVILTDISIEKIQICDLFISGDTGPLHIAAAFGISTLSLFGPSDPGLVAPEQLTEGTRVLHKTIWKKPDCSPCYTPSTAINRKDKKYWRNGSFFCYRGHHKCIKDITVEEVFNETQNIIKQIINQ